MRFMGHFKSLDKNWMVNEIFLKTPLNHKNYREQYAFCTRSDVFYYSEYTQTYLGAYIQKIKRSL